MPLKKAAALRRSSDGIRWNAVVDVEPIAAINLMMADSPDPIEAKIAALVAAHAGVHVDDVRPSTRLWHDLKLAGDDFADLIEDLHYHHGVTLRGQLGDYCPTEGGMARALFTWPFSRQKSYRELTITELVAGARGGVNVG